MTDTPPTPDDSPLTPDDSPPAAGEDSPTTTRREYNCPGCGYDLAGLLDAPMVTCPECARMSSSTLLKRLRPPPRLWPLILRLSLPFVIGMAVQAAFVLSAHWLGRDTVGVIGAFLGCYWPPSVALVAMALARVYWSDASRGSHPRRYRAWTWLVIALGTGASFICSMLMARLTVFS